MTPIEHTEEFVKRGKATVSADAQMDRRVLDDAFAAMDAATGRSSASRMMLRNRWIRIAAAAVILLVIGLLAIQWEPTQEIPYEAYRVTKSPADMVSAMSLNMAYRRGGMEAVDELADVAFAQPESKPTRLSVQDILTESNGA